MNESKIPKNKSPFLIMLREHIAAQLVVRGFCLVFDDDLERCWPSNQMSPEERNSEILRFAESQGWSATSRYGVLGIRVANGGQHTAFTFAIEMYKGLHDLHAGEWVAGWIFATICLAFALWILWDLIRDYYRT